MNIPKMAVLLIILFNQTPLLAKTDLNRTACDSIKIPKTIFCFESSDFYKKGVPVVVNLDAEEEENLKIQVFSVEKKNQDHFQFTKITSEDGLGIKSAKLYDSSGTHSFLLRDVNKDGQIDLLFTSQGYPNNQLLIFTFEPQKNAFRFLEFIDSNPELGENNNFDFNYINVDIPNFKFPFISDEDIIRLPIDCDPNRSNAQRVKCQFEDYKSGGPNGNLKPIKVSKSR